MATYEENAYQWLKRQGYGNKYEFTGIYCIKIDREIVYIGKSANMLKRIAQHYVGIKKESEKKYRIMAEAQRKGHSINFDVLYYAKSRTYADRLSEIGAKEGEFIRQYKPVLNTQIPNEDDWHTWKVKSIDEASVLDTIV